MEVLDQVLRGALRGIWADAMMQAAGGVGEQMTDVRRGAVNPKLKDALADRFCQAVLALETVDECYRFFEDVCTIGEFKAMAQRLEIARLLHSGHTYEEIAARTHASSATISRVRRFLEYGADGYRLVLTRLGSHARHQK